MTSSGDDANAALVCPPSEKERLENRNADDQLEYITWLIGRGALELRESYLLKLHELASQTFTRAVASIAPFFSRFGSRTAPTRFRKQLRCHPSCERL
jgi:hypothetical protein